MKLNRNGYLLDQSINKEVLRCKVNKNGSKM